METIATALGCLPEPEGKSLILKTLHTLDTGLEGNELELIWKPPWGIVFIVSKGTMQASKTEDNQ